jgi:hypothetical protein
MDEFKIYHDYQEGFWYIVDSKGEVIDSDLYDLEEAEKRIKELKEDS